MRYGNKNSNHDEFTLEINSFDKRGRFYCTNMEQYQQQYISSIKKLTQTMNKNSLVNIVYQQSRARQSYNKIAAINDHFKSKINTKIQFRQDNIQETLDSNQMIKITQFNSALAIQNDKIFNKSNKINYSSSPNKHFNIKFVNQFKPTPLQSTHKIADIELRRKDRSSRNQIKINLSQPKEEEKILITSKWSIKKEIPHYNFISGSQNIGQTVAVVQLFDRSLEKIERQSIQHIENQKAQLYKSKQEFHLSKATQINFSKQKNKNNNKSIIFNRIWNSSSSEHLIRKISSSPKKDYSRQINEQKRYQENIEKQKKQILEKKKQLNKNYAKPFIPPENITAFSYVVYEADLKRNQKLKKIKAKRQDSEELLEIRKMFLHSHQVVVSLNSRTAVEIASLTKIMTCVLTLDLSKKYNLNLKNEFVTIGLFQENIGGTSANIKKGEIYSIEQLLYGLMLPSGNDASLAIAVWGGKILMDKDIKKEEISLANTSTNIGEERQKVKIKKRQYYDRFIAEMNTKAIQLSMQKTKYCNSHGLSNPENRSCSFDLAVLAQYAMSKEQFRKIVSCKVYEIEIQTQSDKKQLKQTKNRQSKKLIKKKPMQNVNDQHDYQYEEMMDQMIEDRLYEQEQIVNEQQKQIRTKVVKWQNTHQLLQEKPDLYKGIKTGITSTAGPCLASCIEIKGRRFIIIVLNCKNMKSRMKDTQTLRKWLFNRESIKYIQKNIQQEQNI